MWPQLGMTDSGWILLKAQGTLGWAIELSGSSRLQLRSCNAQGSSKRKGGVSVFGGTQFWVWNNMF